MSGAIPLDIGIKLNGSESVEAQLRRISASGNEAMRTLAGGATTATSGMGRFTQGIGQAGFQIQDFAVQVQGGTNALTALSQQGSQLLGVFGTGGAIAGAALTVGILAYQLLAGKDAAEQLNEAVKSTDSYFDALGKTSDGLTNSLAAQRDELVKLRQQYASLDAEQREYERRELDRRQRANDEAAAGLRSQAAAALSSTSTAQIRRSIEGDAARMGLRAPSVLPEEQALVGALAEFRNGGSVDPTRLSALGTQLERLSQGQGRVAEDAKKALAEIDKLLPKARELAEAQGRIALGREALSGNPSILDTLPPDEPTNGPPDLPKPGRAKLTDAQKSQQAELEAVWRIIQDMEKGEERYQEILARQGDQARQLVASLDPAAAAADRYQKTLEGIAQAQKLFRDTVGTEGGALGITEARAFELQEVAARRYTDELERVNTTGADTGKMFESAFSLGTSRLEEAISSGKSFSDVLKGLDADLARLITRMLIMKPLEQAANSLFSGAGNLFGRLFGGAGNQPAFGSTGPTVNDFSSSGLGYFANGGIMTDRGPIELRRYANGGVANSPQLALFGEGRSPEAYVPLPDGRNIPVKIEGGGGAGAVFNQTVNIDARGADPGVEARLKAAIPMIIDQANAKMLAEISRGGGVAKAVGRR